ncbi:MAG: hypothetical protein MUC50_10550 [Myxococcota bacterium]|jgi:hypothetical protein|nr:hypothetical protein [Myxococcota bacterium]
MPKRDVNQDGLKIQGAPAPNSAIKQVDTVFIVVTQAFCPNGHNLISNDNDLFDNYPGIRLACEHDGQHGDVVLSPFQGDESKKGKLDWPDRAKLKVTCPTCHVELPRMATCCCDGKGDIIKLYLSPKISDSHVLAMCNVWGCRRSRTIDDKEIISEYLEGQIED